MAAITDSIHQRFVAPRRVGILARHLAPLLPEHGRVLDVGCGDGRVGETILRLRPGLQIEGIEVLVRERSRIHVSPYDGHHIPFGDKTFDAVLFVDVLHHADDPAQLLREAARVASGTVVIKDHTAEGWLAYPTLRFLDRVGNARYGVALPFNYWRLEQWRDELRRARLATAQWNPDLHLYPWPATLLFDRSLQFVAQLQPR